jgi:hypothetical protein
MTLIDFFKQYVEKTAWQLLKSKVPSLFLLNNKTINVKKDIGELTYAQFVAGSLLLEKEVLCFDLIRALILIFNWSEITDKKFNIGNYTDLLPLIDNALVLQAYPIARHYERILSKQCKVHVKELTYIPKPEDKQDGIDMFNRLSFYNSCRAVAVNFSVKPNDVMDWNYSEVFVELLYQKIDAKFNENRTKRIQAKNV